MRGIYMTALLLATGAHAGPILDGTNHQHNHMALHRHQARQDETPAEELMGEFEKLYGGGAPAGLDPFSQGEAPPVNPPSPVSQSSAPASSVEAAVSTSTTFENGEEVVTVYVEETEGGNSQPPPASNPPASNPPASNPPPTQPKPKPAAKPAPAPAPAPAKPAAAKPPPSKPAASNPSPAAGALSGMPSAPSDFIDDLSSDSPVYKAIVLLHHNIHRANHSLSPLSWNDTLFDYAKASAESCIYEHTHPTPPYGQNIAAGNAPGNVSADITNGFYNGEIGLFQLAIGEFGNNSPDMSDFEHWGHATQMLWKDTTSVACYTASCAPAGADPLDCGPSGSYLQNVGCGNGGTRAFNLVCNYYPPGNYPDQYSAVPGPDGSVDFVEMTGEGVIGLPGGL